MVSQRNAHTHIAPVALALNIHVSLHLLHTCRPCLVIGTLNAQQPGGQLTMSSADCASTAWQLLIHPHGELGCRPMGMDIAAPLFATLLIAHTYTQQCVYEHMICDTSLLNWRHVVLLGSLPFDSHTPAWNPVAQQTLEDILACIAHGCILQTSMTKSKVEARNDCHRIPHVCVYSCMHSYLLRIYAVWACGGQASARETRRTNGLPTAHLCAHM